MGEEYVLPDLGYPLPTARSPFEEGDHSFLDDIGWLNAYFTFLSPEARKKYENHALAWGAAFMSPTTTNKEHLIPMGRYFQWLTIIDDYYEFHPVDHLLNVRDRVIDVMLGEEPRPDEIGFLHNAAQLRREFQSYMPHFWLERLANGFSDYWTYGVIAESPYKRGTITGPPPFARYEIIHEYAIAMYTYGCLVEPAVGAALPEHVFRDPVIQRLRTLLCRIMAIQNDLHSFRKERIRASEMMNSVHILRHERGLSLAEAVDAAVAIHDRYVAEMVVLGGCLPDFGVHQQAAEEYVRQMGLMITGLERWYRTATVRYVPGEFPEPPGPASRYATDGAGDQERRLPVSG